MKYRTVEKVELAENQVRSFETGRVGTLSIVGRRVRVSWPDGSVGHWAPLNEGTWSEHNSNILLEFFVNNEHLLGLNKNEVITRTGEILEFQIIDGKAAFSRQGEPAKHGVYENLLTATSVDKVVNELSSPKLVFDDVTITATPSATGVTLSFSERDFTVEWTPERGLGLKKRPLTEREAKIAAFCEETYRKSGLAHTRVPAMIYSIHLGRTGDVEIVIQK